MDGDVVAQAVLSVLAVVDSTPEGVVVWHVDTGVDIGLGRMTGAWVLRHDRAGEFDTLTRGRRIVATASGSAALSDAGIPVVERVDLGETVAGLAAEITELQLAFDDEPRPKGRQLVAPEWPELPAFSGLDELTASDAPAGVAAALGISRWLEQLARAWQQVERQRLSRKFLVDRGGPQPRPMPVVQVAAQAA